MSRALASARSGHDPRSEAVLVLCFEDRIMYRLALTGFSRSGGSFWITKQWLYGRCDQYGGMVGPAGLEPATNRL